MPDKSILLLWLLLFCVSGIKSQTDHPEEYWYQSISHRTADIDRIISSKDFKCDTPAADTFENGSRMTAFRFHHFWKHRSNTVPDASVHSFSLADKAISKQHQSYQSQRSSKPFDYSWQYIGRDSAQTHCMGIVISLAVDTNDLEYKTMYAGTNASGLWKTIDGGKHWNNITDGIGLPGLGVNDVDIHPYNPDIIYICTGVTTFQRGYGIGIWKTEDGGDSWERIWDNDVNNQLIYGLFIDPEHPDNLLTLVNDQVYRSYNGGNSWNMIFDNIYQPNSWLSRRILDATFSSVSSATFFLISEGTQQFLSDTIIDYTPEIWFSTDIWADSVPWTKIDNASSWPYTRRASIDVSSAAPENLYCSFSYNNEENYKLLSYNFVKEKWIQIIDTLADEFLWGVDEWCNELTVSPTDTNVFYVGGLFISRITDTEVAHSGAFHDENFHVDIRDLLLLKGSPAGTAGTQDIILAANDGGVSKSIDGARNWESINGKGLRITQYFDLAVSEPKEGLFAGGTQDNGLIIHNPDREDPWNIHILGDNYSTVINNSNPDYIYSLLYDYDGPGILISDDGGDSVYYGEYFPQEAVNIGWPLVSDPVIPGTIYAGLRDGYRSDDHGNNWYKISDFTNPPHLLAGNAKIEDLQIFKQDNNIMYIAFYGKSLPGEQKRLFKTLDGGLNWTKLSANLDIPEYLTISSICIHPSDHNKVWLSLGGFSDDENMRVLYTENSFDSYTDISQGLPGFPVNCIKHVESAVNHLYLCNDLGVYYRNDTLGTWVEYGNGLPVCIVSDLEYHYGQNKIRIATFGRGLWEIDGVEPGIGISENNISVELQIWPIPTYHFVNIRYPVSDNRYSVHIYDMFGRLLKETPAHSGSEELRLDISAFADGIYVAVLKCDEKIMGREKFVVAH